MAQWQQLQQLFFRLSLRQRIAVGLAAVAVIGSLYSLRHWQQERNFKPLFQKLSSEDAGLVLARLRESATEVRLEDEGQTIKVPAEKVDELRIQMASAGLPKTGRIGFELFDKTNFGTSEFAEQVNYHRAIEGELERSVMSLQEVEAARVHITFPRQSLFMENRQPAKASVLLKLRPAAKLSRQNIQAITHLAASAVEGLAPEQVSVLDMRGNLLMKPVADGADGEESSQRLIEYRQRMEKDLLQKIQTTLEPLVGADRFRAAISLDCDMASGDQSEETFDPNRSVMLNSQRSEDGSAPATPSGVPGTPSNLPRPTSRPGSASAPVYRRSENTTFQTSRIVRHVKFPQGQIKRLSASVLLDHVVRMEGGKRVLEAPAPERLRAIKEIVAATVGFQQERGDQVIVEALPFELTQNPEAVPVAAPPPPPRPQLPGWIPDWLRAPLEGHLSSLLKQSWFLIAVILLGLGLLFLIYRMVRGASRTLALTRGLGPGSKKKGQIVNVTSSPQLEAGPIEMARLESGAAPESGVPSREAKPVLKTVDTQLRERSEAKERMTLEAMSALELPGAEVRKGEVLTRHVSELVKSNPATVASLLRTWLEETGR